ncbi:hypothetical protein F8S09_13745 [Deinococcus sp. SDU3-2]|uniref:PD-(D/E)XK endonuclease-like domain-containing protein n=1 Tax=Deinococcus terrestris TaxID=2651870 RepID=A0A7X1NXT5_9DEIO|nr:PD-(D/E)XK nuclease family protein [Deinococcus terrestris]MPY67730.1 hypothetical protein [Deinococcus terrestris]
MLIRTLTLHPSPTVLRHLARAHLADSPGLTLVPNLAAARSLRQLTRQALPTVTFGQQARRALARTGWQPLGPAEHEARLRELLERLNLEYFGTILDRPSTVSTLAGVLRALLRADASRLPPGRSARERDLARLHRTWVLELLRDERYDPAVPEFFAARTAVFAQALTVTGFAYLDAAQIAYLDRLAEGGSRMFLAAAGDPGLSEAQRTAAALTARGWIPEQISAVPARTQQQLGRVGDRAAQHFLEADNASPPTVDVFMLAGVVEEAREVLRQVKRAHQQDGRPWHELAIIVRDEPTYLAPLVEAAQMYGVPLVGQARRSLAATPLGSLLLAWVEAGQRDWTFGAAQRVLTHPLLQLPFDVGARLRSFGRHAPSGLQAWDSSPATLAFAWPESGTGLEFLQALTRALTGAGVLARQRHDPALAAALAALQQALAPLQALPEGTRAAFLTALGGALRRATVPVLPSKGGVRLATPLGTLGRSFQAVWVLGLAEGLFPQVVTDPPLLDAHQRAHWSESGVYLPGGVEAQAIERALFFHALASARERLTLTRPEVGAGGKVALPSSFLRDFPTARPVPELHAGSRREAEMHRALLGELDDPRVAEAARREEHRERGLDPEPVLPGTVNPDTWTWSASQLHAYGACRYRWFGSKVLRLEAWVPPTRGLDPLTRGRLYHLALERLLSPWVGRAAPVADELAGRVPEVLDEAVTQLARAGDLDPGPLWGAERRDHIGVLQRAVRAPDFLPEGHMIQALEAPLDGQLPVAGRTWRFRGYADRVDRTPAGTTIVTDYKLSQYISRVRDETGKLSNEIQLPVYLSLTGAGLGRYFSVNSAKVLQGAGPSWPSAKYSWAEHDAQVRSFLEGVRTDLQRGDFRARPDSAEQACTYCDLQPVCRFRSFAVKESA